MITHNSPISTHRQTVRCLKSAVAQKIRRISPWPAQECRSQRRYQRPRHRKLDCQAHPSKSSPKAKEAYVPCSRPCKFFLPFLSPDFTKIKNRTSNLAFGTYYTSNASLIVNCVQINPYMSNPCHIELILTEGEEVVQKGPQAIELEKKRLNTRQRGAAVRRAITAA